MKVIANGRCQFNYPHGATSGMPHKQRGSLIIWRTKLPQHIFAHTWFENCLEGVWMNSNIVWKSKAVNRGSRILQDLEAPQHERSGDEDRAVGYVLSGTRSTNV